MSLEKSNQNLEKQQLKTDFNKKKSKGNRTIALTASFLVSGVIVEASILGGEGVSNIVKNSGFPSFVGEMASTSMVLAGGTSGLFLACVIGNRFQVFEPAIIGSVVGGFMAAANLPADGKLDVQNVPVVKESEIQKQSVPSISEISQRLYVPGMP